MASITALKGEGVSDQKYTTENSTYLTRPGLTAFLQPDTNTGPTDVTHFNNKVDFLKQHVPNHTGQPSYESNCCDSKDAQAQPLETNNKKLHNLTVMDPITGFVSPAGEVFCNSGKYTLSSFGKARIEPQTSIPHNNNLLRPQSEAINELKRDSTKELLFDTQKVSDTVLKSRLGGWTSDKDPRTLVKAKTLSEFRIKDIFPNMKPEFVDVPDREQKAKDYMYTTSTQLGYKTVNWDNKLVPKLFTPLTTHENGVPDPVKPKDNTLFNQIEHVDQRPQIWQTSIGFTWDRQQDRTFHYSTQKSQFTAPTKRGNHLPGYGGHIGGKNLESMDDVIHKFEPFTVLRTQQPKEPEANYKPNIPGYTGNKHYYKTNSVSHYDKEGRPFTTTAAYHRIMPRVDQFHPENPTHLAGDFTQIQTKVPPCNTNDYIHRPVDTGVNHSIDNMKHPIVIGKRPNQKEYLAQTHEREIKSILKRTAAPIA